MYSICNPNSLHSSLSLQSGLVGRPLSDRPKSSDYKSCSSLKNVYIEYYPGVIKSNKTHISKLNMFNFVICVGVAVHVRGRVCVAVGALHGNIVSRN